LRKVRRKGVNIAICRLIADHGLIAWRCWQAAGIRNEINYLTCCFDDRRDGVPRLVDRQR
jgi:hypothetical protein